MKQPWTFGQKNEYLFKSTYCRFKIWFGMKNRNNKTFFGIETNCTPLQIATGRVQEVIFDKQKGYENCLQLEERFRKEYETAIIYQRKNGEWVEVKKYRLGQLAESADPDLSNPITTALVMFDDKQHWFLKRADTKKARTPEPEPVAVSPSIRTATIATTAGAIARQAYGFTK